MISKSRRTLLIALAAFPAIAFARKKSLDPSIDASVPGVDLLVAFSNKSSTITSSDDARLKALAQKADAFHVVGRGDAQYIPGLALARAAAIRERLIVHGADGDLITCMEAGPREISGRRQFSDVLATKRVAPVQTPWVILPGESGMREVLVRWGSQSGWRVDWQSRREVPVGVIPMNTLSGDFMQVAESCLAAANAAGHALQPEAYVNKVLVIR